MDFKTHTGKAGRLLNIVLQMSDFEVRILNPGDLDKNFTFEFNLTEISQTSVTIHIGFKNPLEIS